MAEVVALRERLGADALLLAGGTDLGVQLRRRQVRPSHLISLSRVEQLRRVEHRAGEITVGAAVTHRTVEREALFADALAALPEACRTVGSVQTRNVGTLGGNLCNASPAADTPPVLLALGATVETVGPGGSATLALDAFLRGYRETALGPHDVLTAIRIPAPTGPTGSAFVKLGRRRAMEISIVCAGVLVALAPDGTCARVGIGLGSVAEISLRATAAEALLRGAEPTAQRLGEAGRLAAEACRPIDDLRASARYRHDMTAVVVNRALERALARARAAGEGRA